MRSPTDRLSLIEQLSLAFTAAARWCEYRTTIFSRANLCIRTIADTSSGSIFASTEGASLVEARWLWFDWAPLLALPIGGAAWCSLKLTKRKRC
jgi:hypothetical protein